MIRPRICAAACRVSCESRRPAGFGYHQETPSPEVALRFTATMYAIPERGDSARDRYSVGGRCPLRGFDSIWTSAEQPGDTTRVSAALDRRAYAELTTSTVPTGEAFAYWREMICATFVRLAAEPLTAGGFSGRIEHVPVGNLELSAVVAGSQHVRRTRSFIAQGNEEYL